MYSRIVNKSTTSPSPAVSYFWHARSFALSPPLCFGLCPPSEAILIWAKNMEIKKNTANFVGWPHPLTTDTVVFDGITNSKSHEQQRCRLKSSIAIPLSHERDINKGSDWVASLNWFLDPQQLIWSCWGKEKANWEREGERKTFPDLTITKKGSESEKGQYGEDAFRDFHYRRQQLASQSVSQSVNQSTCAIAS